MNRELREEGQNWQDKIGYTCFWDLATFIFWFSKWMTVREVGQDWQDKTETMFLDLATFIFSSKVCTIKNNTNLNSIFCLIKSSKIDFIFLPAFYLIIWLMTLSKSFEKIAILKMWGLFSFWGVKIHFGEKKA